MTSAGAVMIRVFIIILLMMLGAGTGAAAEIEEDFSNLDNWEPLEFPKIERYSEYTVVSSPEAEAGGALLRAQADASASGLIFESKFTVAETPYVEWRWMVEDTVAGGDARSKAGDDYAMRIYIIFPYDPDEASFGTKLKYNAAKLIYGEYPPLASLNYVWANRAWDKPLLPNAFTDRAVMFPVESGTEHAGQWRSYRVDIREDYRAAFGKAPPKTASLAVMSDTDNTGAKVTAYLDYIRVVSE